MRLSHDISHALQVAPNRVLVVSLAGDNTRIHATLALLPPDATLQVLPPRWIKTLDAALFLVYDSRSGL